MVPFHLAAGRVVVVREAGNDVIEIVGFELEDDNRRGFDLASAVESQAVDPDSRNVRLSRRRYCGRFQDRADKRRSGGAGGRRVLCSDLYVRSDSEPPDFAVVDHAPKLAADCLISAAPVDRFTAAVGRGLHTSELLAPCMASASGGLNSQGNPDWRFWRTGQWWRALWCNTGRD